MTVTLLPLPAAKSGRTRDGGLDWVLFAAVAALLALGVALVWSATSARDALTGGDPRAFLSRQLVNVALGLALMVVVASVEHRWVRRLTPVAYLASLAGLVLVLAAGSTVNGSRSWLVIGPLNLQPSELAKLTVVVAMALVASELARSGRRHRAGSVEVAAMLAVAGVPAVLILLQPDLGTLLVLAVTVLGVLTAAGAGRRWLALVVGGGLAAVLVAGVSGVLQPYQVDRFLAFTDPSLDPRGAGYNTEQARIAIGNGGLFGQGLFSGSQTRSGFVPEQHTDFIFTVAGEELGLVGAGLLVVLLGIVIWRALAIAAASDDVFGRVAAAGIACWFGFQTFQNVGMCLGIMPVTGVPLPFVSYGGSSLFASLLAVGLLQNIHLRRSGGRWGALG